MQVNNEAAFLYGSDADDNADLGIVDDNVSILDELLEAAGNIAGVFGPDEPETATNTTNEILLWIGGIIAFTVIMLLVARSLKK